MKSAVCVLLPLFNAQDTLEAAVTEILDVLPEWNCAFGLWLIDDGSSDETVETAFELSSRYPQVSVMRNPVRQGLTAAIAAALDRTGSDLVLFSAELYALDPNDLRELWQLRELERKQSRDSRSPSGAVAETWLKKWPRSRPGRDRTLQMVHRAAFEQFRQAQALEQIRRIDRAAATRTAAPSPRPNFLTKSDRARRKAT